MSWFQRHLHWTLLLSYLPACVSAFIAGFVMAWADPNVSDEDVGGVAWLAGVVTMLVVAAWVIRQKGRSLWWLLLSLWFSPLWLENKKRKPEPLNS